MQCLDTSNAWLNLLSNTSMPYLINVLRNTNLQYLVKFTKEYKHAIPGQIYKGIQACNAWLNLLRNTHLQCLVIFIEQ